MENQMSNKGRCSFIGAVLAGVASTLVIRQYLRYRQEITAAEERLLARSRIVDTRSGPVEVAVRGRGEQPVLMIHGAGGGYDQALYFSGFLDDSYRKIAVSRFGYLRTPLPADASPEAQAEAHAALLDALDIPIATIVGMSAGGPSALHFAHRYPERCKALILISAITMPLVIDILGLDFGLWLAFRHDFLDWFMVRIGWPFFYPLVGITSEVRKRLSPEDMKWLADFITTVVPLRARKDGIRADWAILPKIRPIPLSEIGVPTLVIHAGDDPMVSVANARRAAREISDVSVSILPSGGHLLLGHHDEVQALVAAFMRNLDRESP
jgi:pimeloyl-ACP methyl ester carboxylesterase